VQITKTAGKAQFSTHRLPLGNANLSSAKCRRPKKQKEKRFKHLKGARVARP